MTLCLLQRVCHRLGDARDEGHSSDLGFSLAEVIVSVTLFVAVAAAAGTAIIANIHASRSTDQRVQATALAQSYLSQVQSAQGKGTVPANATVRTPDGFTVRLSISPDKNTTCAQGSMRTVSVVVFAPGVTATSASAVPSARTDTALAC